MNCSVNGCDKPFYARTMCRAHYERWRTGRPSERAIGERKIDVFIRDQVLGRAGDDCLMWPFAIGTKGYGVWGDHPAHRAVCILAHGQPPSVDHQAAHSCGNRSCVNPHHLRWATREENEHDKLYHGTDRYRIGQNNHFAKLTYSEVNEIRRLRPERSLARLSAEFGVSKSHIARIASREAWK